MTAAQNNTAEAGTDMGMGTPGIVVRPADDADTAHAETDNQAQPPAPRKIVGRQAGFVLCFEIIAMIAATLTGAIAALALGKDPSNNITAVAWSQLMADIPAAALVLALECGFETHSDKPHARTSFRLHFHSKTHMTVATLALLIAVILTVQICASGFDSAIDAGIKALGLSRTSSQSKLDSISYSLIGVLAICLVGPICEETLFRGIIMENLRRFGSVFAIVTSSLLFGFFHGDITQSFFAFFLGLVLGYTAWHYSLAWSIALHIGNNLLSTVLDWIPEPLSDQIGIAASLIALLAVVIVAIAKHTAIKTTVRSRWPARHVWRAWCSPLFIFALALCVLTMIGKFNF